MQGTMTTKERLLAALHCGMSMGSTHVERV